MVRSLLLHELLWQHLAILKRMRCMLRMLVVLRCRRLLLLLLMVRQFRRRRHELLRCVRRGWSLRLVVL